MLDMVFYDYWTSTINTFYNMHKSNTEKDANLCRNEVINTTSLKADGNRFFQPFSAFNAGVSSYMIDSQIIDGTIFSHSAPLVPSTP